MILYPRETPPHTRTARGQPPAAHRRRHGRPHHRRHGEQSPTARQPHSNALCSPPKEGPGPGSALRHVDANPSTKEAFHFEVFLHESMILFITPPPLALSTIAIRLQYYCVMYDPPPDPPFVCHTPYNLAMAISCKGQGAALHPWRLHTQNSISACQLYLENTRRGERDGRILFRFSLVREHINLE